MKIALISTTTTEIPPQYGGEIFFWLLAKGFAELGHEVTLYAPPKSKPPEDVVLRYIRHTYGRIDFSAEAMVWKRYGNEILKHDMILDCSHNHLVAENIYYFHPEHKDRVLNVLNGICSTTPRPPYNLIVGSQSWKECLVKGISQFHGTFWSRLYGDTIPPVNPEAIKAVIPWGTDVSSFPYEKDKEDYWLFISRLTPYKGAHNFIKLARKHPEERFVMAFPLALDDHRYWYEKYRPAIESTPNIEVVKNPDNGKKIELLSRAKALIFCHESCEAFGLIPLEAMACGTPVIATAMGALPEFVKEGGILCGYDFEKQSVKLGDFVEAMNRIDEIRPSDARKNAERYDYKIIARRYIKVYRRVEA